MRTITYLATLFIVLSTSAQDKKDLPGDVSLPSSAKELQALADLEKGTFKYSVEDYFQRPKQRSFQFSPNGKYMSYREKDEQGKNNIYVKDTETGEVSMAIKEGEDLVRRYEWANDSRLIYVQDKGGDENYHLFAADLDGSSQKELTPYDDVRVTILSTLEEDKDHMIIEMNKEDLEIFEPYRININTGKLEKLYDNPDQENPIASYDFDKDGELRAYMQQYNGVNYRLYYQVEKDQPFQLIREVSWKDEFYIIGFDYTTEYPHDAFMLSNLDNDTEEIVLYDLKAGMVIKKVYSDSTYDMGGMSRSRKRGYEVDYVYFTGEKFTMVPVSNTFKKLHKEFSERFGDKTYYITSVTDAEDKFLLYVTSDRLYGKYFMYNKVSGEFKELLDLMPSLNPEDMATMKPIKFTSRDGLVIHGYLTIPKVYSIGKKVPLIVNPHGGPYGPRDNWGFNPETQLFASRGYATLQVNYRGSGGYGKKFSMEGNKQIGRKMLNDLEDGVAFVKELGMIDENKIAIYGASYGGLATLGSLVKTPDLYTCGVDYVGVSNLFTFFKSFPPYWKPYLAQVYEQWYDENDPADVEIMKQVSPALNVDKITKPLFVVQGANDPRVKIEESDQVVRNLRQRGYDVPYMVKYDEGHGFGHEENSIELYECMMGFFAKHLSRGTQKR